MFFRQKKSGKYTYVQIVENQRDGKSVRQRVMATIGRLDQLQASGQMDSLVRSGLRFCEHLAVVEASRENEESVLGTERIGPDLVFSRLWDRLGIAEELHLLLRLRRFGFAVERAIYLTVVHRLCLSGSDRAAEKWKRDYRLPGCEDIRLHHLYRAMAFLGEELPPDQQVGKTPFSPRCIKDLLEEGLFARRRDLFSDLQLVFFDTTSIYFEGEGGALGERGHSKDSRPDLKQMVVGVVLDTQGTPVCCEMWPGNTADVKSLIPVANRLRSRFGIQQVCIVADRGMISQDTIQQLESAPLHWNYILGARMRRQKEVSQDVLRRAGAYQEVFPERTSQKDHSPLKVKEVWVQDHRYVVCVNEEQRRKDAHDREAIVQHLRDQLKQGDKSLIGNKGYRKFIKTSGAQFKLDEEKIKQDARFDGKWILRTNMELPARDVALIYKQLWTVEDIFRTMKSILETRPIYHKCTETIRGHVFCSFLALCLRKALQDVLASEKNSLEWNDIIRDLNEILEIKTDFRGKTFLLRSTLKGCAHQVLAALGIAPPKSIREIS
jgi:transposase